MFGKKKLKKHLTMSEQLAEMSKDAKPGDFAIFDLNGRLIRSGNIPKKEESRKKVNVSVRMGGKWLPLNLPYVIADTNMVAQLREMIFKEDNKKDRNDDALDAMIYAYSNLVERGNKMNEPKTLNELANEIHKNAIDKGFYEVRPTLAKSLMNMHSELSEAWEADRNHKPMVYYTCGQEGRNNYGEEVDCTACDSVKPEGVAVEIVDCVIRALDTLAFYGIDIDKLVAEKMRYNKTRSYKHGNKKV